VELCRWRSLTPRPVALRPWRVANKSIETRGTAMKTVTRAQDRTGSEEIEAGELALPPSVQAALGELVNAAKDGLLALSVGVGLGAYEHFASRDPLSRLVLEQMLAGVSTRRLRRTREPVGEQVTATERSVSKSAVSRAFVSKPGENLAALMSRGLADVRLAVLMIDGIDLKGPSIVVALGIS